jgi:hypothetical protein
MNVFNNPMGVAAPVATGHIVGATNSFNAAFLVAGLVLLAAILSYVFQLGEITPLPDHEAGVGTVAGTLTQRTHTRSQMW